MTAAGIEQRGERDVGAGGLELGGVDEVPERPVGEAPARRADVARGGADALGQGRLRAASW